MVCWRDVPFAIVLRDNGRPARTSARASHARRPAASDRWYRGAWFRFLRAGDYSTDTSGAPLSRTEPVTSTFVFPERKCRFSLVYPTKLLLIQNRILSRRELPALGCSRRLGETETASL